MPEITLLQRQSFVELSIDTRMQLPSLVPHHHQLAPLAEPCIHVSDHGDNVICLSAICAYSEVVFTYMQCGTPHVFWIGITTLSYSNHMLCLCGLALVLCDRCDQSHVSCTQWLSFIPIHCVLFTVDLYHMIMVANQSYQSSTQWHMNCTECM